MSAELAIPQDRPLAFSGGTRRHAPRWPLVALLAPGLLVFILPFLTSLATLVWFSGTADLGIGNWSSFLADAYHWKVIGNTLRIALIATAITVALAYPTAHALAGIHNPWIAAACYTAVCAPLFVSTIAKLYGWFLILSDTGMVNTVLATGVLGLEPTRLIYNEFGVVVALVHGLLPFAVLPIVSVVVLLPRTYVEAARDLGAGPVAAFVKVTLPLTAPGVLVATQLVFAFAISTFVTPAILGGGRVQVFGPLIYDSMNSLLWGAASVQSIVMLMIALGWMYGFQLVMTRVYSPARGSAGR